MRPSSSSKFGGQQPHEFLNSNYLFKIFNLVNAESLQVFCFAVHISLVCYSSPISISAVPPTFAIPLLYQHQDSDVANQIKQCKCNAKKCKGITFSLSGPYKLAGYEAFASFFLSFIYLMNPAESRGKRLTKVLNL